MDVQELPLAVDIGDLEPNALPEPQATSVDRGEADAIDGDADAGENPPHLVAAQDDGEFLLALGPGDVEHIPRPRERLRASRRISSKRLPNAARGRDSAAFALPAVAKLAQFPAIARRFKS